METYREALRQAREELASVQSRRAAAESEKAAIEAELTKLQHVIDALELQLGEVTPAQQIRKSRASA